MSMDRMFVPILLGGSLGIDSNYPLLAAKLELFDYSGQSLVLHDVLIGSVVMVSDNQEGGLLEKHDL